MINNIKRNLSEKRYFKALEYLAKFKLKDNLDKNTELVLFDCLKAPCFLLRYEALFKMCKTPVLGNSYSVRTAIIECLYDESWLIRTEALQFLSSYIECDKRVLEETIICLKDESPYIVKQALFILEPYINKSNSEAVFKNCLRHKYLSMDSANLLLKIASRN